MFNLVRRLTFLKNDLGSYPKNTNMIRVIRTALRTRTTTAMDSRHRLAAVWWSAIDGRKHTLDVATWFTNVATYTTSSARRVEIASNNLNSCWIHLFWWVVWRPQHIYIFYALNCVQLRIIKTNYINRFYYDLKMLRTLCTLRFWLLVFPFIFYQLLQIYNVLFVQIFLYINYISWSPTIYRD